MKRLLCLGVAAIVLAIIVGSPELYAQGVFKVPFKFQAGGKKLPAGEYWVAAKGEGNIVLRKDPGGEEVLIPFKERLAQPIPPLQQPQLVFDVVGNFEPSYTEYVTDYLLSEIWFPGAEGFLVHVTKGAHQKQTIKGQKVT